MSTRLPAMTDCEVLVVIMNEVEQSQQVADSPGIVAACGFQLTVPDGFVILKTESYENKSASFNDIYCNKCLGSKRHNRVL